MFVACWWSTLGRWPIDEELVTSASGALLVPFGVAAISFWVRNGFKIFAPLLVPGRAIDDCCCCSARLTAGSCAAGFDAVWWNVFDATKVLWTEFWFCSIQIVRGKIVIFNYKISNINLKNLFTLKFTSRFKLKLIYSNCKMVPLPNHFIYLRHFGADFKVNRPINLLANGRTVETSALCTHLDGRLSAEQAHALFN